MVGRATFLQDVQDVDVHEKPALVIVSGDTARSTVYALRKWRRIIGSNLIKSDYSEFDAVVAECTQRGHDQNVVWPWSSC